MKIREFEPEDERTTDKSWAPDKTERLQALLTRVAQGELARGRSLKYWENLRLKPRHLQMVLMQAAGFTNNAIANATGYTPARVSVILNHPDARTLAAILISYAAEDTLDIKSRIQAHAGEALDTVLDVMRNTRNDGVRKDCGFELLKMAGYSGVEKKTVQFSFKVEGPAAQRIADALSEESDDEEEDPSRFLEDAEYEIETGAEVPLLSDGQEAEKTPEPIETEAEDDGLFHLRKMA